VNCNEFDISVRINKAILKGPGLCSKQAVGILNTFMAVGLPSCYPSFLKRKVMSLYINALHMHRFFRMDHGPSFAKLLFRNEGIDNQLLIKRRGEDEKEP
jgi:hypothetical protein